MDIVIDKDFNTSVMYSLYNQTHTLRWRVSGWLNHWTITLVNRGKIHYTLNDEEFVLKEGQLLFTAPPQDRLIYPLTDDVNVSIVDFYTLNKGPSGYKIFTLPDTDYVNHLIGEIVKERASQRINHQKMMDALAMQIVTYLLRLKTLQTNPEVDKMKSYIIDNFAEPLQVSDLAKLVGFSESYCGKLFKKHENCSIPEYINRIRINTARVHFTSGETSVNKVAYQCGFTDPFHFSKVFKTNMGMSPTEFIKRHGQT